MQYLHLYVVTQLCLTLWDPLDCTPLGPSVHGIFQARILKWLPFSSSRGSSPKHTSPVSLEVQINSLPTDSSGKPHTQKLKENPISWFSSVQSLSRVQLFATPWTAAFQASLSVTNSRSLLKLMYISWCSCINVSH